MIITVDSFKSLFPRNKEPEAWVQALNEVLPFMEIDTPKRVAAFLAQCGHESNGFNVLSENLNYSASALNRVFPKYFHRVGRDASLYHRQPEKIANIVYANRMGNGDTESGDGWKFRGRGPIQITGRNNYTAFAEYMFVDPNCILDNPDLLATDKNTALVSAAWFWAKNNLNKYADSGNIKRMTRIINGGYNGLKDRINHYNHALKVFGEE